MSHEPVVLVGVDGSAPSLHALDWATGHAKAHGCSLHLVCSYTLPSFTTAALDGGYAAMDDSAIQEGARAVLDEAIARVSGCGVRVTSDVATGDAAAVLIELSRGAAAVVVGSRGRGGFAERLLGTVSSALPAHAHCPTIVVPSRQGEGGEQRSHMPVKRIVVGVDGSPAAEAALTHAIHEAEVWGAELTAVAGVPVGSGAGLLAWLPAAIDHEQVLRDVAEGLDVVVDRALEGHDLQVRRHVLDGTGAALLTEFSTAVDMVVVGSRGRGGFAGLLLGSTSQAVLHHSVCPVTVVRAPAKDDEWSPTAVGVPR